MQVKVIKFDFYADHLFIEIGESYEVKNEIFHNGKLVGYEIYTPRNIWMVELNQIENVR